MHFYLIKGTEIMVARQGIILSIGLLVSNRKDTIQKCLDSLTPIREAIPTELIILDTGCDKDLRDLLERYADKIDSFTWCNDFSKARNVTLDMAEGEWFLYLDDDEWFTDVDELISFFGSGKYKNYGSASYIQRNYLDFEGTQYTDSWVGRMIKRESDTRFRSKIHEYLAPRRDEQANIKAIVDHYGYVYKTEEDKQKHFERNYVLIKEMIEEEPDELRWKMQLVQELRTVNAFEEMVSYGEKYLNIFAGQKVDLDSEEDHAIGVFYASIIYGYLGKEYYENAYIWCLKLINDSRTNKLSHAFAVQVMTRAAYFLKQYEDAIKAAQSYLQFLEYFEQNQEELYSMQKVPFVCEAFDVVKIKEVYSILICSDLKLGNVESLGKYMGELQWEEKQIYVFEEIAEVLAEAMLTMEPHQEFVDIMKIIKGHSKLSVHFSEKMQAVKYRLHEEEMEKKRRQRNELEQLKNEISKQVMQMIANGQNKEALLIIENLKKIMPDDLEVVTLELEAKINIIGS